MVWTCSPLARPSKSSRTVLSQGRFKRLLLAAAACCCCLRLLLAKMCCSSLDLKRVVKPRQGKPSSVIKTSD